MLKLRFTFTFSLLLLSSRSLQTAAERLCRYGICDMRRLLIATLVHYLLYLVSYGFPYQIICHFVALFDFSTCLFSCRRSLFSVACCCCFEHSANVRTPHGPVDCTPGGIFPPERRKKRRICCLWISYTYISSCTHTQFCQ